MAASRLYELFAHAIELLPAERLAFVDAATVDDPRLRAQLLELLAADSGTGGSRLDALLPPTPSTLEPGTLVAGRYRIRRKIGEGGMGVVYEAEQADLQRRVALKFLRPGLHDPLTAERLRREGALMAALHHPGIAQVYEAGVTDDEPKQPFLAMEFVDGAPLLPALRDLPIRAQLQHFVAVCEAVQHAHAAGIVHRDLKPSNLLLDRSTGTPKILDFGIARALSRTTAPTLTRTHEIVGTLGYMSPEQLSSGSAASDARADVWALGATLYELLAGRLPFDLSDLPLPAVARRLLDQDPEPLRRHARHVDADLAVIVHKALTKDPERRYANAGELAADLQRFLRSEPIVARPPSAIYLAARFARRHRGLVIGVALALLALVGGLITAIVFARQEARQRAIAENTARDLRELLRDSVFRVAEQLADLPAATAARAELVRLGLHYTERLAASATADPGLRGEVAMALSRLAGLQGHAGQANLGDPGAAIATYRRALEWFAASRQAGFADARLLLEEHAAVLDLAQVLRMQGALDDARAVLRQAGAVTELLAGDGAAAAARRLRAQEAGELGNLLLQSGDAAAALTSYEQLRAALVEAAAGGDEATVRALSEVHDKIGQCLIELGRLEAAATACQDSFEIATDLLARAPVPANRRQLASASMLLAQVRHRQRRYADAVVPLQHALELLLDPAFADPSDAGLEHHLAMLEWHLATAWLDLGDVEQAAELCAASRRRNDRLRQLAPGTPAFERDARLLLHLAGRIAGARRDAAAAAAEFAAAIAACERAIAAGSDSLVEWRELASAHGTLGGVLGALAPTTADERERARLYRFAAAAYGRQQQTLAAMQKRGWWGPLELQQQTAAEAEERRCAAAAAAIQPASDAGK
jgi:tRNA A-37 threonylcarbamoyl transferase component Bud32